MDYGQFSRVSMAFNMVYMRSLLGWLRLRRLAQNNLNRIKTYQMSLAYLKLHGSISYLKATLTFLTLDKDFPKGLLLPTPRRWPFSIMRLPKDLPPCTMTCIHTLSFSTAEAQMRARRPVQRQSWRNPTTGCVLLILGIHNSALMTCIYTCICLYCLLLICIASIYVITMHN